MKTNAILIDPATKTLKEVFWKESMKNSFESLLDLLECEATAPIRNYSRKDSLWVNSEAQKESLRERELNEKGAFIYKVGWLLHPIHHVVGKALYQREYGRNGIAIPLKYDFEKASKLFYL